MRPCALFAIATAISLTLSAVSSAADTRKEACIAAHEAGQPLRRAGKLAEAISKFELCASDSCPALVRAECARRQEEAQRAMPTVRFIAKNGRNERIANLLIGVDGSSPNPASEPIVLEPGLHRFELVAEGYVSVTKKLSLAEGLRAREEVVMVSAAATASTAPESDGSARRTLAYVVGGTGIVAAAAGVVLYASARANYQDYDDARRLCSDQGCESKDASDANDALSTSKTQTGASIALGAVAAVLLGSGIYLWLSAPSASSSATSVAVAPGALVGTW